MTLCDIGSLSWKELNKTSRGKWGKLQWVCEMSLMASIYCGDLMFPGPKQKHLDKLQPWTSGLYVDMWYTNIPTITVRIYFHVLHFMDITNMHMVCFPLHGLITINSLKLFSVYHVLNNHVYRVVFRVNRIIKQFWKWEPSIHEGKTVNISYGLVAY